MTAGFAESSAPDDHPDASNVGFLEVERLEFGKYTVTPDGPVESNAEHTLLGRSPGYPDLLARVSEPSLIGTVAGRDRERKDVPHGTVLRPVVIGGVTHTVFCRITKRSESGDPERGRGYTAARYFLPRHSSATPLALYEAMETLPIAGLTRAEGANLTPLRAAVRQLPILTSEVTRFVRMAVVYVMSGVPVNVVGPMSEQTFFECVACIWFLLPQRLRPLLSAGWGVGDSFAGTLTITATLAASETAATFIPASGHWKPPVSLLVRNSSGPEVIAFDDRRLTPGRMYAWYAFQEWDGDAPRIDSLAINYGAVSIARTLPPHVLPEMPSMSDADVIRVFRYPGLRAYDHYRLSVVDNWLRFGVANEPDPAATFASNWTWPSSAVEALSKATASLMVPEQCRRAEQLIAAIHQAGMPATANALDAAADPGSARARLIAAVSGTPLSEPIVETFTEAVLRGEAAALQTGTSNAVITALNESLALYPSALECHVRLLTHTEHVPDFYRQWLQENALNIVLWAAKWRMASHFDALDRLAAMTDDQLVRSVIDYMKDRMPTGVDRSALTAASPEQRAMFARQLAADWTRTDSQAATRRESILRWGESQTPTPLEHPLLRLALKSGELTERDIDAIADDAKQGRVPRPMTRDVSALVLRNWKRLQPRVLADRQAFSSFTTLWPKWIQVVLLNAVPPDRDPVYDEEIETAAASLELAAAQAQSLIEQWAPQLARLAYRSDVATLVWRLATTAERSGTTVTRAVDIVVGLAQGRLAGEGQPGDEEIGRAVELFRYATPSISADFQDAIWQNAVQWWQIRTVLECFPRTTFRPAAQQLEILAVASAKEWLTAHMSATPAHRGPFGIATAGYFEIDYNPSTLWSPDYSGSFLWGAFQHVPVREQGGLRAALRHYAVGVPPRQSLIRRYIDDLVDAERDEGVRRVVRDYLIPDVFLTRSNAILVFDALSERAAPAVGWRRRLGRRWRRFWARIRRRPVLYIVPSDVTGSFERRRGQLLLSENMDSLIGALRPSSPDVLLQAVYESPEIARQ